MRDYSLLSESRLTIYAGDIPELVNQSFGTVATFAFAGAAERAMYFGTPLFSGGHESAGATELATQWFLAEGATGSFFTTFVLLSNPNPAPAHVTLTYLREGGGTVARIEDGARRPRASPSTCAEEDATLAATSVATRVTSDLPIVVERAMYWPLTPASWLEAQQRLRRHRDGAAVGLRRRARRRAVGLPDVHAGGQPRHAARRTSRSPSCARRVRRW